MIPHTRTASPRMTSTISNSFRLRILIVCTRRIHLPHTSDNETGQEAGICTRTVSFTGRDAADYTTVLRKWCPRQELHLRPPPSQSGAPIYLSYVDKNGIRGRTRTD